VLLTRSGILKAIQDGYIGIEPFNENQLNPNSYDLRLGRQVLLYEPGEIDAAKPHQIISQEITDEGILLQPGELYLMATEEVTTSANHVPGIEGRSSVGRLGVNVHATAGFGDVGFHGTWTLEVSCVRPVRLYAGMRICQIYYTTCSEIEEGDLYAGKYLGQHEPCASRIYRECDEWHCSKSGI
jgi:dCTP deaminase